MLLDDRRETADTQTPVPAIGTSGDTGKTRIGILADEPRLGRAAGDFRSVSPWAAISPNTKSKEWPHVHPGGIHSYKVRLYRMRNHTSRWTTHKEAGCRYHLVFGVTFIWWPSFQPWCPVLHCASISKAPLPPF